MTSDQVLLDRTSVIKKRNEKSEYRYEYCIMLVTIAKKLFWIRIFLINNITIQVLIHSDTGTDFAYK
jgi:hypothetical protein